jgi:ferredoxin-NADP reductase
MTVTADEMNVPSSDLDRRQLELVVREAREESVGVRSIVLCAPDGCELPVWQPGAHIQLALPSGRVRSYSLCSDPKDRSHYRIAVLREEHGQGGSVEVHTECRAGRQLRSSLPRNEFELNPADRYLLIAGGIGVTPLLPMAMSLARQGTQWRLVYLGRSKPTMAFHEEIAALGGTAEVVAADERGRLDIDEVIRSEPPSSAIYCCGPNRLMTAVADVAKVTGHSVHVERFGRPDLVRTVPAGYSPLVISDGDSSVAAQRTDPDEPFEVELAASGKVVSVERDQTILSSVRKIRQGLNFTCLEGYCGTCETAVLAGVPDHRDTLLSEEERAANATMMICVSRSKTGRLVLDL